MPVGFPDYYGGLTLPVTVQEGGTGLTSVTSKAMLYGAGTSGLIETNVGVDGDVLQINNVTHVPTFQALSGPNITPPVTLTPYQQDALLIGSSSDLPAARGALEIAAPSGSTVNPLIVSIATTQLMNFSPAGNLIIAGALTLGSPLAVAQGGTGSASPGLTGSNGISVTGSWPNNTLAITAGFNLGSNSVNINTAFQIGTSGSTNGWVQVGTGQAFVAGVAPDLLNLADQGVGWVLALDKSGNLGLAGTLKLGTVLATAYGGTGSASPALTAGSNIDITGTWPNNTIALATAVSTASLDATSWLRSSGSSNPSSGAGVEISYGSVANTGEVFAFDRTGAAFKTLRLRGDSIVLAAQSGQIQISPVLGVTYGGTGTATPSLVAGSGISITGSWPNQTVALSGGGTAVTLVASTDLTAQNASLPPTTIYTPGTAGLYRISVSGFVHSPTGTSTLNSTIRWTQNGTVFAPAGFSTINPTGSDAQANSTLVTYVDGSTNITYSTAWTSGGGSDSYDLHIRAEKL